LVDLNACHRVESECPKAVLQRRNYGEISVTVLRPVQFVDSTVVLLVGAPACLWKTTRAAVRYLCATEDITMLCTLSPSDSGVVHMLVHTVLGAADGGVAWTVRCTEPHL
jgi:hypothetical protein